MKALVVFDSFFSNTEQIAAAIGEGLWPGAEVAVLRAAAVEAQNLQDLDLLIVGSPTRGFRPTEAIVSFLDQLPPAVCHGAGLAAFDTRIAAGSIQSGLLRWIVAHGGYAAKAIASGFSRRGGHLLLPPEGFVVAGTEGPLLPGELDRARSWGGRILEAGRAQRPAVNTGN